MATISQTLSFVVTLSDGGVVDTTLRDYASANQTPSLGVLGNHHRVHGVDQGMTSPTNPSATGRTNRRSTQVVFELERTLTMAPQRAWDLLVDWPGHGEWVPMTRVQVDEDNPERFTAWTGLGRVALEDRMEVRELHFDGQSGSCRVEKLGPIILGEASFTVAPGSADNTAVVTWREDILIPYLPKFMGPVAGRIGAFLFGLSLRRMARLA
jgi:hypothetical protein